LVQSLPISGNLKAVNTVVIKSRVAGEITQLSLREGDYVKAGQVVARVDPTEYQRKLRQAEQQADAAKAQVDIAKRQYDNNKSLVDKGFISVTALETSFSNLSGADATYKAALSGADVARKVLDDAVLTSPISGQVSARLAQPGEFTQRAYLNDRMDLAQAEAVADLIAAGSAAAARAAVRSLSGEFSDRVNALAMGLLQTRALCEASLDFPDERDVPVAVELAGPLASLEHACRALLEATRHGVRHSQAPRVVLAGRPNAGKSSLLNAFAREDTAIVTPVPGTTRDVLQVEVELAGVRLTLLDTAGLRDTTDVVEQEGVRRARAAAVNADLVLYLVDSTDSAALAAAAGDIHAMGLAVLPSENAANSRLLVVLSKVDLAAAPENWGLLPAAVHVSTATGEGLEALQAEVLWRLGRSPAESVGAFSARERHVLAATEALEHLVAARAVDTANAGGELVAEELRLAQDALGAITGRTVPDDVLAEVFGRFCIGK
jgi:tRNA modification GTPase